MLDSQSDPKTELQRAEEALKAAEYAYRKLTDKMPDGVYKTTHQGRVVDVNPAMVKILGFDSREELIGIDIKKELYFNPDDRDRMTLAGMKSDLITYRLKSKSGKEVWVEDNGWYTYDENGEILFHEGVIRDVTEKMHILEDLISAKNKAEESDRLKSAFLMNMSHEIRTPMNGILGFLNLLMENDYDELLRKKYIDIVNKSGQRLLTTINDIIEISRIESTGLVVTNSAVNVLEVTEGILDFFQPQSTEKGLSLMMSPLSPDLPEYIETDRHLLEGILTNLIRNAIKFTVEGRIEVGVYSDEKQITFYVKDTGIGIPADRQEAIFDRFVQADLTLTRTHEGTGLGLTISKAYANALGGTIRVESEPGAGSTFFVGIPLKETGQCMQKEEAPVAESIVNADGMQILIVDDDESSFQLLDILLTRNGVQLLHATNGLQAIEMFRRNPSIALILMDLKMPVMDGFQATRQIRELNAQVPIIVQTAHAFSSEREKARLAGCTDYITKPIDAQLLNRIIKAYSPQN